VHTKFREILNRCSKAAVGHGCCETSPLVFGITRNFAFAEIRCRTSEQMSRMGYYGSTPGTELDAFLRCS
jgi:hypothetical protein